MSEINTRARHLSIMQHTLGLDESIPRRRRLPLVRRVAEARTGCGVNQTALPLPGLADAAMERAANLSACGAYRYTLSRRWAPGGSSACWIMLNPSTADAEVDDPTIREVIRFSRLWGYQAAIVVNLYPFRSSSPAECRRWADWEGHGPDWAVRDLIQENAVVIAREARHAELVIAAWGAAPWASDWAQHVAEEYVLGSSRPWDLYCLGTNSDGSPRHPLARGRHRVPREQRPVIYEGGAP